MIDIQTDLKTKLEEIVQNLFSETVEVHLEEPKNLSHGDLSSNIAMVLAKKVGKNPMEIAEMISKEIESTKLEIVKNIEVLKPGFINFKLDNNVFKQVLTEISKHKSDYGKIDTFKNKTYLIEHSSPNPNKELHLGHLKNTVTGLAVSYIVEAAGAKVFRDCIDNNRGIAIAKLMWGYLKFAKKDENLPTDLNYWYEHKSEWLTPKDKNLTPGKFMDMLYVLGSKDYKENPEVEEPVRKLVLDWEAEEPKNLTLWKQTQDWVWEGYRQSLGRIGGWQFDQIWHESDIYKNGKEHVQRGVELGVFKKLSDGAVLTDLKKDFNLPDTILIKKDGSSLYITQDIELTKLKREKFNPDEMMWVIGPEQSLQMKQMFAVCSQLGFGKYEEYHHLAYGFILVKEPSGKIRKLSSREGAYHVNDLVDISKDKIKKFIKSEFSQQEKDELAEKVAVGAIKYSLLRVTRLQDMIFDIDNTISFEGDSGPYLMYTYTRAKSILNQSKDFDRNTNFENYLNSEIEIEILKKLIHFPEVIKQSATEYLPHLIANYVYDIAQKFNTFYNSTPVLKTENIEERNARLLLVESVAQVIQNGLKLLGIETVERM